MEHSFKITKAEIKGEEVVVFASFYNAEGVAVKEIIHAFPRSFSVEEIRDEVGKALDLYVAELEQVKEQVEVDKATEKDNELINNLIS